MQYFVYVCEMIGYGVVDSHPTKIGVSRHPPTRIKAFLNRYGGYYPSLVATFPFENRLTAYHCETAIKKMFARHAVDGTEFFDINYKKIIDAISCVCSAYQDGEAVAHG